MLAAFPFLCWFKTNCWSTPADKVVAFAHLLNQPCYRISASKRGRQKGPGIDARAFRTFNPNPACYLKTIPPDRTRDSWNHGMTRNDMAPLEPQDAMKGENVLAMSTGSTNYSNSRGVLLAFVNFSLETNWKQKDVHPFQTSVIALICAIIIQKHAKHVNALS